MAGAKQPFRLLEPGVSHHAPRKPLHRHSVSSLTRDLGLVRQDMASTASFALTVVEPSAPSQVTKRVLDVLVSSGGLILLAPLCALIALLVWAEDGGSAIYAQTRVGRNGRRFRFFKFRSMVQNADALKSQLMEKNEAVGPAFKMRQDPRITRVGRILRKYSLDELPQLWNVLRGDMSLVGPRPHLPTEVERYQEYQKARLSAQPGLICLREVTGRSHLSFDQWVMTDLLYLKHRSFGLDLQILCHAVPAVLKGEGAY